MNLADHLTIKKILKVTIFPIIMMIFTSLYSIVDGLFISNFANKSSFAAVNLVMPFLMIIGSIGFMMGAGGTALVSRYLGQKEQEKANNSFSLIVYATIVIGIIISFPNALSIQGIKVLFHIYMTKQHFLQKDFC